MGVLSSPDHDQESLWEVGKVIVLVYGSHSTLIDGSYLDHSKHLVIDCMKDSADKPAKVLHDHHATHHIPASQSVHTSRAQQLAVLPPTERSAGQKGS